MKDMKKNLYVGVVLVKVKAPKGYRPFTMTFKFGIILDNKSEKLLERIKAEHISKIKTLLETQNPGLTMKFSSEINLTPILGFSADYFKIAK